MNDDRTSGREQERPRSPGRLWRAPLLLLLAAACASVPPARVEPRGADAVVFGHERFDRVLSRYVDGRGQVDYAGLQANRGDLYAYLEELRVVSPDSHPARFPDADHRLAYWINAYNAQVIGLVLDHHPLSSVLDVRPPLLLAWLPDLAGFFVFQRITLGGDGTNLYDLENRVVRHRFGDPRIHFALNCASTSCPRLPREAFDGANLQRQLDREARRFVAEDRNVAIDLETRTLSLSSIFDWYESDFTDVLPAGHRGLPSYVERYLTAERAARLRACDDCAVVFVPYDWGINDQRRTTEAAGRGDPDPALTDPKLSGR